MKNKIAAALFVSLFSLAATVSYASAPAKPSGEIEDIARLAVSCLKNMDWNGLAGIAHPIEGVKFSPYAYVEKNAVRLSANRIKGLGAWKKTYTWGVYDGTGEPIKLTFDAYYPKFIYDEDFMNAPEIGVGRYVQKGNSISNIEEFFGDDAVFVEFNYPGAERNMNLDWASLRLVFRKYEDAWRLVGVVHDSWTI